MLSPTSVKSPGDVAKVRRRGCLAATVLLACLCALPAAACEPLGYAKPALLTGAGGKFAVPPGTDKNELALALVDCLGSADPELRDAIGYTGLATLLRAGDIDDGVVRQLRTELVTLLNGGDAGGAGFLEPFAALALAEVARVDRISPLFSADERAQLVDTATAYLGGIRDYRGYSDTEGWRHGVAHGADLLLQLVLNPALDAADVRPIVRAALSQVRAANGHAYIYGEGRRLARPVLFAARRDVISATEWQDLFAALTAPPGASWDEAFRSSDQLAVLHNLRGFLLEVYAGVAQSPRAELAGLRDAARTALEQLP
ncbi:MAG: DUF2785 domain-containing protein [Woeseiaceae bacterium]|nr:DUF2785 domain-containing protein [Woeseiaceae bacterium]